MTLISRHEPSARAGGGARRAASTVWDRRELDFRREQKGRVREVDTAFTRNFLCETCRE